jgi:hypothetical protein
MPDTLFDRERAALARLLALVRDRAEGENRIAAAHQEAAADAEREVQKGRRQVTHARKKAEDELEAARQQAAADIAAKYAGRQTAADRRRAEAVRGAEENFERTDEKLRTGYQERLWTLDSLFEAGEKEADDQLQKFLRTAEAGRKRVDAAWEAVAPLLARVGLDRDEVAFDQGRLPPPTPTDPEGKLQKCLEDTEAAAGRVQRAFLPKLIGVGGSLFLTVLAGAAGLGVGLILERGWPTAAIAAFVGALVGGGLLWLVVYQLARRQVRDRATALGVFQAETERAVAGLEAFARTACDRQKAELKRRHANDRKRTDDHFLPQIEATARQRELDVNKAEVEHADRTDQIAADKRLKERAADTGHRAKMKELTARFDAELKTVEDAYRAKMNAANGTRDADWNAMAAAWQTGLKEVGATLDELTAFGADRFPDWATVTRGGFALPTEVPGGVRYGEQKVDLFALPEGEPLDQRLAPERVIDQTVPAYLPFPDRCAILLKAADQGRTAAVAALQAMMLRFLTGLPPGKVRFTIIDPVGLGENFAAFMHLADFDEKLVGARIWTEPGQIDRTLTDLTEHMENVIQKYLRNQYRSIEEYNRAAGEVAEPYRVLVVANFPTNFTPEAARRLVSIMSSGPACGVCTLVGLDAKAAMPRDFRAADLEQAAFNLVWKDGKFVPTDPVLAAFPLAVDAPPGASDVAAVVRRVGEASRDATRVEVPFEFIMPPPERWWTGSTARGFDVPIGRAGATKKQMFMLGRGTAQHALVAGKTGSGKSTLLHALITNLVLTYSPDEAELYLIDFKKGVEFKAYADAVLPHARVVAIESEREFGLSVLQKLDAELRERGDRFRQAGVNDLDGYREARPHEKTPRILLIVDEFQEFFVEDDKLAQEAALLLDRLVRQGRAFGLHILLGSQTLGGAYSLARSTIDQMAVRIALQCSDADAQLILSKDNNAARLLSRPGEAIYNDANGLVEGNDPFQVVWLDEGKREHLLGEVRSRANGHYPRPLVFEGNVSADLASNAVVRRAIENPPAEVKAVTAWLGDAVAIKDPTAAVFRPQSGANLLLIGQQEEAALALMSAAMLAIVAQSPPVAMGGREGPPLVTLFDGTPDDADHADYLRKVAAALGLPAPVERYEMQSALAAVAAEIDRRTTGGSADRSPRFVLVQGVQRFRELRKAEDDFGFGRKSDQPKSPGELFTQILKEGPAVGVHVIVWCDSLTNLNRAIDRQAAREFTQRVLFQMSAQDSSTLIDTPAASRLGRSRALFVQEELERPEKFRPFGLADLGWLRQVGEKLAAREAPATTV